MSSDISQLRMLRQDIKSLEDTRCVAAYNTTEAILKRDAVHPIPVENTPTYKDTLFNLSDNILDNKYKLIDTLDKIIKDMMIKTLIENEEQNETFFNTKINAMTSLTSTAFHGILSFCDTNSDFPNDTNSNYHRAKQC